jgi:hypothetical protein
MGLTAPTTKNEYVAVEVVEPERIVISHPNRKFELIVTLAGKAKYRKHCIVGQPKGVSTSFTRFE